MIALKQYIKAYQARGFKIRHILGDGQLRHACKDIEKWKTLNITSQVEHVSEIERYIRTVNERVPVIVNTLPFKQYPTC